MRVWEQGKDSIIAATSGEATERLGVEPGLFTPKATHGICTKPMSNFWVGNPLLPE